MFGCVVAGRPSIVEMMGRSGAVGLWVLGWAEEYGTGA